MEAQQYQPEIDGIRAIAVMSVVLFHLEYPLFPGGFVGVDVFFVISGFLITRLIIKDAQAGTFSFKQFYLRRIRRLGPALIVMLAATFAISVVYLTPDHFQRFSGALMSSVFSVSNLYFWAESGYFDASAELKPLLHTWSLSVEEQFYLVWPAMIVLLARRPRWVLPTVIFGLSLLSLVGARWLTSYEPSASFFLMPFRVYEFGLGAGLALLPTLMPTRMPARVPARVPAQFPTQFPTQLRAQLRAPRLRNLARELLCVAGIVLIGYSVLFFDSFTPFPDVYALLPCLGALLLIGCGTARYAGWLLRNPLSVWLGRISYSLYLVHWPIVVLYKHITFEDVVVGKTRVALLLLTLLAAVSLYVLVENRFRLHREQKSTTSPRRVIGWLAAPLVLSLASAHAFAFHGWSGRFDAAVVGAIGDIEEKQLIRRQYIDGPEALSNLDFDAPADDATVHNVLVMGDSHATDMFNALYLNLAQDARFSVRRLEIDDVCLYLFAEHPEQEVITLSAAEVSRCGRQLASVQQSPLLGVAERVVLSTRWEASSLAYLQRFTDFLVAHSAVESPARIIVMGRTAEFKNVPSLILKNGLRDDIEKQLAAVRFTDLDALNDNLRQLSEALALSYVDKLPFLCDGVAETCDAVDERGRVLYTDYGHWTVEGARIFGLRMLSDDLAGPRLTGLSSF